MTEQRERLRQQGVRALVGIAPIFKLSWTGVPTLVGTGFWATESGLLVTAWHVIQDNFDKHGKDVGPLIAVQTTEDLGTIGRAILRTTRHREFDLCLSQTAVVEDGRIYDVPTIPLTMTVDEPPVGAAIFTHSFTSPSQSFANEKVEGIFAGIYRGAVHIPELNVTNDLHFTGRIGFGYVTEIYENGRDRVMLPFPCFQSDVRIYGANSGGPIFDTRGRICGVNVSSFDGFDAAFHIPTKAVLGLRATNIRLVPEDPVPRTRTILELGLAKRAHFDPELIDVLYRPWQARIMRPYIWLRYWLDWIRWKVSGSE